MLPTNLPDAWTGELASARAIADSLSVRVGKALPWATVRAGIDGACRGRLLELTANSGPRPCDLARGELVKLRAARKKPPIEPEEDDQRSNADVLVATAYLGAGERQKLAERIGEIRKMALGSALKLNVGIEPGGDGKRPPDEVASKITAILGEVSDELKFNQRA